MSQRFRICMVSDFFYPNMGGVEMHIFSLAQCLIQQGHKVIVVTHAYGDRQGIRYMRNGLKVYYMPLLTFYDEVTFPTFFSFFPLFRNILCRENIHIVHGHQSTSTLTNQCILLARTLGFKTCFTDHSLFGFTDSGSIHVNTFLKASLSDIDCAICVSNACRENLVLRASLHPSLVYTIPNAVDASKFQPDPSMRFPLHKVNIIILSRLVYRKGIDLLVKVIPLICAKFPAAHFIIGGDGPKKILLEEMRETYVLHERVELIGSVPHHQVRDVLVRGHIFLSCSLTESFCIALLEATCCGLFVVSTNVGGVPEVLPPSMVKFADPTVQGLVNALTEAISISRKIIPRQLHERMKLMYSWYDVAERTEKVYDDIMNMTVPSLATRILRYQSVGTFSGIIMAFLLVFLHLLSICCEYMWPKHLIEMCPDVLPPPSLTSSSSSSSTTTKSSKLSLVSAIPRSLKY